MEYLNLSKLTLIAPEICLSLALFSLLILSAFSARPRRIVFKKAYYFTLFSILISFAMVCAKSCVLGSFYGLLVFDELTVMSQAVLLLSTFLTLSLGSSYLEKTQTNNYEYFVLVLFSLIGMMFLVASSNLMSIYLSIELQSLSFYVLSAFQRHSEHSTESGLKYFILGSLSSGILLFGLVLVYGFTGTTQLEEISMLLTLGSSDPSIMGGVTMGAILCLIAFFFKLGGAPFHMWLPDVYEGAPSSVTSFFAIVPKIALFSIMFRLFYYSFYAFSHVWTGIIIAVSVASMVIGSLGALQQYKMKRLLAYSAIAHMGYMLIAFSTNSPEGLEAVMLYLIVYIFTNFVLFGTVLSLMGPNGAISNITDLRGLSKVDPLLSATVSIALFSMAGIPPLAGFYSKMYIFFSAIESSMYALAIIGVVTSVISCVYYLKIIKLMYFDAPLKGAMYRVEGAGPSRVMGLSLIIIAGFFFYPSFLFLLSHNVSLSFLL